MKNSLRFAIVGTFIFVLIGGILMARGTPDGGYSLPSSPIIQVTDLGEQANRLLMGGGANSMSGRWLWATGFESGLAEVQVTSAASVTIVSNISYQGKQSVKITLPAIFNATEYINKFLQTPIVNNVNNRYGVEVMVSPYVTQNAEIEWNIRTPFPGDLTKHREFKVVLAITGSYAARLYTETSGGVRTEFANVGDWMQPQQGLFHYSKLVVDMYTGKYVRFIFSGDTYDISSHTGSDVATRSPQLLTLIGAKNKLADSTRNIWFDNLVITGDEP